jgi:hypothetical protein
MNICINETTLQDAAFFGLNDHLHNTSDVKLHLLSLLLLNTSEIIENKENCAVKEIENETLI